MFTYLRQLWHSPELRSRILITIGLLLIYRVVAHIPVPADKDLLSSFFSNTGDLGVVGIFSALTGGASEQFSLVMLGLSPYINASIIMQLCTVIFPKLEALSKEGQQGQQQINKYTRWLAVPLAFVQSYGFLFLLSGSSALVDMSFPAVFAPMIYVTAGSLFIMWLGEMITEKGIGNGISLLIFAGIVSGVPSVLGNMLFAGDAKIGAFYLFCIVSLATLVAVILFTDAHRLIPLTYANQGAGRGVQGNIPIRLNQAGMIPIIFAISLITLPAIMAQFLQNAKRQQLVDLASWLNLNLSPENPTWIYIILYFLLVIGFTYFYVSVTFKPEDVAETIQKRGGFIPGIRPGKPTAELLAKTSNRLNLWGGGFLGIVAIVPLIFTKYSNLTPQDLIISGSGLIIIVGVVMELIRQINAQLLAHDYDKLV